MKAIDLLINSELPPDLRDPHRKFNKKGVEQLLADVAHNHPEEYVRVSKMLTDAGRHSAYLHGETITLNDLKPVVDKKAILKEMDQELDAVKQLPAGEQEAARHKIWSKYAQRLEKETQVNALARGNNLGNIVVSGSRGNSTQLSGMLTTPGLYTDYKGDVIPMLIRHGFNEGLRPYEYMASTFGARQSVISTKNATAETGDFGKQLAQNAAATIVTEDDCGTTNGIDYAKDDPELRGRVLAKSYPGLPAGTVVDKHVAAQLRKLPFGRVIVRSPMTCTSHKGICAHCLGLLPEGRLAPLGYAAGITSASALGEPLTQGSLNTKHKGGAGTGEKAQYGGFDIINQIAQSPETFPFKAAVATTSGPVTKIEDAPQGGKYVHVADTPHYVLPGFEPSVKVGETVEAGDGLSEGIIDVADILKHRGLGEARRYYVDRLREAYKDSGIAMPTKLNLETMARTTLDHVMVDDPDGVGDYLPDDTASYNRLITGYHPPADARLLALKEADGKYLQSPALHFTIGTKLTPKMLTRLEQAGFKQVHVSDKEPRFHPEMIRLRTAAAASGGDWLAKMHTSYLTSNLQRSAERGEETNVEHNVHFAPRLAFGKDFGKEIETTGEF